jgi:hypothetical protein
MKVLKEMINAQESSEKNNRWYSLEKWVEQTLL